MATRRSRLQVKPNIGGPKSAAAKLPPTLKIPDQNAKKLEGRDKRAGSPIKSPRATSPLKSPKIISPVKSPRVSSPIKSPRVTAPLKGPRVAYPIRANSPVNEPIPEKVTQQVTSSVDRNSASASEQKEGIENNRQNKNETFQEKDSETLNKPAEKPASAPTRARLRRFGTVNIAGSRGVKTDESRKKTTDSEPQPEGEIAVNEVAKQVQNAALDTLGKETYINEGSEIKESTQKEGNLLERSDEAPDTDNSELTSDKPKQVENDKSKPKPAGRARLPKAKPNIQDAGRKRPRPSGEENSGAGIDNSEDSSAILPPPPPPSTSDSVADTTASAAGPAPHIDDLAENSPIKHTFIHPKPTLPKSPQKASMSHPLQMSPMKSGGKLLTGEKDKWARPRTVSTSEGHAQPPPPKRVKKPKVLAPTDKPPDRGTMRMRDLIHWNPSSNPMKVKEKKPVEVKEKAVEKENKEEKPPPDDDDVDIDEDEAMPVPQVTIGPDGNIVINEQSLVVKNTSEDKGVSQEDAPIDETEMFTTYGTFRANRRSRRWSEKETAKFYKALAMVGIDFFLIQKMLPNRKRFEIKKKFKSEERKNNGLIERVLRERVHFDDSIFDDVSSGEELDVDKRKREKLEKKEKRKQERVEKKKEIEEKKNKSARRKSKSLTTRTRKMSQFYYDSTTDSEGERELEKNFQENPDSPRQPAGVSKAGKDREVVGILMDMSEGRLPNNPAADNFNPTFSDNVQEPVHVEVVNQPYTDVAVNPAVNQQSYENNQLLSLLPQQIPGIQSIVTVEVASGQSDGSQPTITGLFPQPTVMDTTNVNSAYLNNGQAVSVSSEQNSVDRTSQSVLDNTTNVTYPKDEASHPTLTGLLHQPSGLATINTTYQANGQAVDLSINSEQTSVDKSSQSVLDNGINATNQITPLDLSSTSNAVTTPQEMGSSGNVTLDNEVSEVKSEDGQNHCTLGVPNLAYNSANTVITQQILSSEAAAQLPGLSQGGPNDQYMLVTVMPESGQETVIHVYRLHGGLVSNPSDGQAPVENS